MIAEAIKKIVNKGDLTYDEAYQVMNEIMDGATTQVQNAAFLAALSTKSTRAETIDEISGCAAAMRAHALKVDHNMDVLEVTEPRASTFPQYPLLCWLRAASKWQNTETGQPPPNAALPTVWKRSASISFRSLRRLWNYSKKQACASSLPRNTMLP